MGKEKLAWATVGVLTTYFVLTLGGYLTLIESLSMSIGYCGTLCIVLLIGAIK